MNDVIAQYKDHLRALFKDDPDEAQKVLESMGAGPWEGTGRLNLAVFGFAAQARFKEDHSHESVMKFVADTREAWSSAEHPPSPLHVELLVRSALGETDLFDEVPPQVRAMALPILAYVMIGDLRLSDAEIDELLDDAERRATDPA